MTILGHVITARPPCWTLFEHTDVAGGEAGGITQNIGAYQIQHKDRTNHLPRHPGMRVFVHARRGAQGADIVVLVVAADVGVQPQTASAPTMQGCPGSDCGGTK